MVAFIKIPAVDLAIELERKEAVLFIVLLWWRRLSAIGRYVCARPLFGFAEYAAAYSWLTSMYPVPLTLLINRGDFPSSEILLLSLETLKSMERSAPSHSIPRI